MLNLDVLDLDDLGPFDLIVAVSTLEHVGRDESPRDPRRRPARWRPCASGWPPAAGCW